MSLPAWTIFPFPSFLSFLSSLSFSFLFSFFSNVRVTPFTSSFSTNPPIPPSPFPLSFQYSAYYTGIVIFQEDPKLSAVMSCGRRVIVDIIFSRPRILQPAIKTATILQHVSGNGWLFHKKTSTMPMENEKKGAKRRCPNRKVFAK